MNSDGTHTRFEMPGLQLIVAKPADESSLTDEITMPATSSDAVEFFDVVKKAIVDTGTKFNLMGGVAASRAPYAIRYVPPERFTTANGPVWADTALEAVITPFGEGSFLFHILQNTPTAISLGNQVMEGGLIFLWVPQKRPLFVLTDGSVIVLDVHKRYSLPHQ